MNLIDGFGKETLPSVIKNPFEKDKIYNIQVEISDWGKSGKWKAKGLVRFSNGDTDGQQNFEGETFDEVVVKIKKMMDNF